MPKIADLELKSDILIAPMAGITNGAFRKLCYLNGAAMTYTEMISDKAIFYNNRKTLDMLNLGPERPIAVQLFGSEVNTMVYAAKYVRENTACDLIDINMGCPVNKVVKTGAGSALMLDEKRAVEIAGAVVKAVDRPVSVKMRLGYDHNHLNFLSLAQKLEAVGVAAICLHARTRSQFYEGQADWSKIKELRQHISIPLIGNGDVTSLADYLRMKEETGCDFVMIGRGVIGDPFLIKEIANYNAGLKTPAVGYKERFAACLQHAQELIALKGEKSAISELRGLASHYLTGLYNCSAYKKRMAVMSSLEELEKILADYEAELAAYQSGV